MAARAFGALALLVLLASPMPLVLAARHSKKDVAAINGLERGVAETELFQGELNSTEASTDEDPPGRLLFAMSLNPQIKLNPSKPKLRPHPPLPLEKPKPPPIISFPFRLPFTKPHLVSQNEGLDFKEYLPSDADVMMNDLIFLNLRFLDDTYDLLVKGKVLRYVQYRLAARAALENVQEVQVNLTEARAALHSMSAELVATIETPLGWHFDDHPAMRSDEALQKLVDRYHAQFKEQKVEDLEGALEARVRVMLEAKMKLHMSLAEVALRLANANLMFSISNAPAVHDAQIFANSSYINYLRFTGKARLTAAEHAVDHLERIQDKLNQAERSQQSAQDELAKAQAGELDVHIWPGEQPEHNKLVEAWINQSRAEMVDQMTAVVKRRSGQVQLQETKLQAAVEEAETQLAQVNSLFFGTSMPFHQLLAHFWNEHGGSDLLGLTE